MKNNSGIITLLKKGRRNYQSLVKNAKDFFAEQGYEIENEEEFNRILMVYLENLLLYSYTRVAIANKEDEYYDSVERASQRNQEEIDNIGVLLATINDITDDYFKKSSLDEEILEKLVIVITDRIDKNLREYLHNKLDETDSDKMN